MANAKGFEKVTISKKTGIILRQIKKDLIRTHPELYDEENTSPHAVIKELLRCWMEHH